MNKNKVRAFCNSGFTIIELLVVMVVIGILAAILYVSFSGVVNKAEKSKVEATLSDCAKSLEMYRVQSDLYPLTDQYSSSLLRGCPDPVVGQAEYDYSSADGSSYRMTGTLRADGFVGLRVSPQTTPSSNAYVAQVLLVAGGGGGGSSYGGGGGGGGIRFESYSLSEGTHTIYVGNGGSVNNVGGSSSIDNMIIAAGGGAGGSAGGGNTKSGGSGGGSSGSGLAVSNNIISGGNGGGSDSIGSDGGTGGRYGGGGGGGAGGNGSDATGSSTYRFLFVSYSGLHDIGGYGGPAAPYSISGRVEYFASGGKGANNSPYLYPGGYGGHGGAAGYPGGPGTVIISTLSNWMTITGDGLVSYTDSNNNNLRTSGPYDGGHTIYTFRDAGTYHLNVTYN